MKITSNNLANLLVAIAAGLLMIARLFDPSNPTIDEHLDTLLPTRVPQTNPTQAPITQGESFVVEHVADGDTLTLSNGEKVRLIGIDSPEMRASSTRPSCYGKESRQVLKDLVEGKTVTLMKDKTNRDRYGRLLRYVFVDDGTNNLVLINEKLVMMGAARASSYPPDTAQDDRLANAQAVAQNQNIGLWSACDTITP